MTASQCCVGFCWTIRAGHGCSWTRSLWSLPSRPSPLGGPGAPADPVCVQRLALAVRATRGRVHAAGLPSLFVPPSPRPSVSASLLSASSSPSLPGKFHLVPDPPCRVGSSPRGLLCAWFLSLRLLAPELWPRGLSCSAACAIFPDQELNPCLSIGRRFLATESREAPQLGFLQRRC